MYILFINNDQYYAYEHIFLLKKKVFFFVLMIRIIRIKYIRNLIV